MNKLNQLKFYSVSDLLFFVFSFLLVVNTFPLICQLDSTSTLQPTGKYNVGTTSYQFTDYSRSLNFKPNQGVPRTINIKLWYPGKENLNPKAPYAPFSKKYSKVSTNSILRSHFSEQVELYPLIIIFPGRGMPGYAYSNISEELASHGYSVIAIDIPEIGYLVYPDGYIIQPSDNYSPGALMRGPYEKVDSFFQKPVTIGLKDVSFAIGQLKEMSELNYNQNPLTMIDFSTIGVLGHSLGGRIGGAYADAHHEVKAYISMEGIPPRKTRFNGMDIPQAHMVSSGTYPYAQENYQSIIDNLKNDLYVIILDKMGHNSVTDFPLFSPSSYDYEISPQDGMIISRTIILEFFNKYLFSQMKFDELEIKSVRINRYDKK